MDHFPTPSVSEYLTLMQLKRLGVRQILIKFSGDGGSGCFENPIYKQTPSSKKAMSTNQELSAEFKKAKDSILPYLEKVAFSDRLKHGIGFTDGGCRGEFLFSLEAEQPSIELTVKYPRWITKYTSYAKEEVHPDSEIVALVAELQSEKRWHTPALMAQYREQDFSAI